jgi:hypothetical protein
MAVPQTFGTCDRKSFAEELSKRISVNFVEKATTVKWLSLKNGRFQAGRPGKPPESVKLGT